jgi:large subunit ribosomal protein L10
VANPRNQTNLAALRTSMEGVTTFFVVDYQGLTAGKISQLRRELTAKGGRLVVSKNTLINIVLKDAQYDFTDVLHGPSALVLAQADPAGIAKTLSDFAKGNDKGIPNAKAGLLLGQRIDAATVAKLASLGTLDTQRAELVGVLSAHMSNFVGILEAYKDKLEESA